MSTLKFDILNTGAITYNPSYTALLVGGGGAGGETDSLSSIGGNGGGGGGVTVARFSPIFGQDIKIVVGNGGVYTDGENTLLSSSSFFYVASGGPKGSTGIEVLNTNIHLVSTLNGNGFLDRGAGGAGNKGGPTKIGANGGSGVIVSSVVYNVNDVVAGGGGGATSLDYYGKGQAGGGDGSSLSGAGGNAKDNTGGGGGGKCLTFGPKPGSSGVAYLQIPTSLYTGTYTGTVSAVTEGPYTILKFLNSGTYTTIDKWYADSSNFNRPVTLNGGVELVNEYNDVKAAKFNGQTGFLSVSGMGLGNADFTIETFASYNVEGSLGNQDAGNANGANLSFGSHSSFGPYGSSFLHNVGNFNHDTWYHLAVVRLSGVLTMYVNGSAAGHSSDTTNYLDHAFNIGGGGFYPYFNGKITGYRVVRGTALYTSNFTVPIVGPTAVTGTQLLLNFKSTSVPVVVDGYYSTGRFVGFKKVPGDGLFHQALDNNKYYFYGTNGSVIVLDGHYSFGYIVQGTLTGGDEQVHQALDTGLFYVYHTASGSVTPAREGYYFYGYYVHGVLSAGDQHVHLAQDNGLYYFYGIIPGTLAIANGYYSYGYYQDGILTAGDNHVYEAQDNADFYLYGSNGSISLANGYYTSGYYQNGMLDSVVISTAQQAQDDGIYYFYSDLDSPRRATGRFLTGYIVNGVLSDGSCSGLPWAAVPVEDPDHFYDYTSTIGPVTAYSDGYYAGCEVGKFVAGKLVAGDNNIHKAKEISEPYYLIFGTTPGSVSSAEGYFSSGYFSGGYLTAGDGEVHQAFDNSLYYVYYTTLTPQALSSGDPFHETDLVITGTYFYAASSTNDLNKWWSLSSWWGDLAHIVNANHLPISSTNVMVLSTIPPYADIDRTDWVQPSSIDTGTAGAEFYSIEHNILTLNITGSATFSGNIVYQKP